MHAWHQLKRVSVYALILGVGLAVGHLIPRLPMLLKPSYQLGDFADHLPDPHTRVVVYGTANCSFCRSTRAYLMKRGIKFADLDVEISAAAAASHAQLGGGGVPVVVIGRRLIRGYQPEAFDAALANIE